LCRVTPRPDWRCSFVGNLQFWPAQFCVGCDSGPFLGSAITQVCDWRRGVLSRCFRGRRVR
jgi:hypothetical protein